MSSYFARRFGRLDISESIALSDRPPPKIFAITSSAWEADSPALRNASWIWVSAT